jgi:hypothetical protein
MKRAFVFVFAIAVTGLLVADSAEAGRRHRRGGCGECGGGYSSPVQDGKGFTSAKRVLRSTK